MHIYFTLNRCTVGLVIMIFSSSYIMSIVWPALKLESKSHLPHSCMIGKKVQGMPRREASPEMPDAGTAPSRPEVLWLQYIYSSMIAIPALPPIPCFCRGNISSFNGSRASSQTFAVTCFMINFGVWAVTQINLVTAVATQRA